MTSFYLFSLEITTLSHVFLLVAFFLVPRGYNQYKILVHLFSLHFSMIFHELELVADVLGSHLTRIVEIAWTKVKKIPYSLSLVLQNLIDRLSFYMRISGENSDWSFHDFYCALISMSPNGSAMVIAIVVKIENLHVMYMPYYLLHGKFCWIYLTMLISRINN